MSAVLWGIFGALLGLIILVFMMPFLVEFINSYFSWCDEMIDSWKEKRYYKKHPKEGLKL